jgi:hypothetical protein
MEIMEGELMPKKPAIPRVPEVQASPPVQEASLPKPAPVYKFWNKAKCPRCGGTDTEAYATHGPVQSRVCRVPICRWRWKVTGKEV